jgi:hypothetical protein
MLEPLWIHAAAVPSATLARAGAGNALMEVKRSFAAGRFEITSRIFGLRIARDL